ncbi:hypothetical protein HMPREF1546_04139 [Oscillibacter sp. KLE 1745]|nr:hypothetical protein HMPREF1546_04139 [Oscillibacter sp. KLE 1745]
MIKLRQAKQDRIRQKTQCLQRGAVRTGKELTRSPSIRHRSRGNFGNRNNT